MVLFITFTISAQKTAIYTNKLKEYNHAVELYQNKAYVAAQQKFNLLKSDFDNIERIQVVDILGRTLIDQKLNLKELFYEKEFSILNGRSGLYFVNLISGKLCKTIKMVVE